MATIIKVKFTEGGTPIPAPIREAYFAGLKGFSPIVDMEKTGNVTKLTITDEQGPHVTYIADGSGGGYPVDNETLIIDNGVMKVNTTNLAEQDNTRPITSAGTFAIVGNIEVLLKTI